MLFTRHQPSSCSSRDKPGVNAILIRKKRMPSKMDYKDGIHKFSTKPPGHEAARLRENQRRHRAKVKGRITDLEETLESTQGRLDDALKRIEELTAEVQRLQSSLDSSHQSSPQTGNIASTSRGPKVGSKSCSTGGCNPNENADSRPEETVSQDDTVLNTQNTIPISDPHSTTCSPPTETIHTIDITNLQLNSQQNIADDPNDDCALLPPPNPGESTMRCREAYSMIKDRIMPEFDPDLVTEWLKPGFRRATCPGDGCRVQTHILFALVDHITSG